MIDLKQYEVWFVTGSQHLYGAETLRQVAQHSEEIVRHLNGAGILPLPVVFKPVLTTSEEILALCQQANTTSACVGVIAWMHTFSPARNWIAGLSVLHKPLAHLHTQFNQDLPFSTIDMDFMNLNQSAHGDREFGALLSRMRKPRKVVVGHWQDEEVQQRLAAWARAACGWGAMQGAKVARFGDNMRSVAVTEGDKVEAQLQLGYAVHGYGIGDLVDVVQQVSDAEIDRLVSEYEAQYVMAPDLRKGGERQHSVREAARIEIGLRQFLEAGEFVAFTDSFEDLHGLEQLPGLAVQRLMAEGYGFGGEGDWKTAALVRTLKVMSAGLAAGTSFMEDYTYHLHPGKQQVLGAHMLEVCPSIARGEVRLEVHPLGIGGKADPARLVFDAQVGAAINVSLVDVGNRFRLVLNEVEGVAPQEALPKLPVARALWEAKPSLKVAAGAWIYAGGAHHTVYSLALRAEHVEDWAGMAGVELVCIDGETKLREFQHELLWNDAAYLLHQRL